MNKVQFFYDDDLIGLEQKINDWLSQNKDVKIMETNLNSLGKPSQRAGIVNTEKYVFYILYSTATRRGAATMEKEEEIITSVTQMEATVSGNLSN